LPFAACLREIKPFFAFGRLQSSLPKALKPMFAPPRPPLQTLFK
jgi:hypothetical protein